MSLVNISLIGNLCRAPESQVYSSGRNKTTLNVAINTGKKKEGSDDQQTDFYRVECWGKLGELAAKYLSKGQQVGVTGKLTMDNWTDRDGNKRVTPTVEAAQLSLPPRATGNGATQQPEQRQQPTSAPPPDDFGLGEDEIPF